ncbi:DUF3626 domain-containing protein [Paenibacillus hodogayensis]|uniref:DUF3626 domain-containing protein n=1 Tax=Paenibacillus hodogayensis TaxID=279208 RepID=A0ABV5VWB5_9BACL
MAVLTAAQSRALEHVRAIAAARQNYALEKLQALIGHTDGEFADIPSILSHIRTHARVTLNFHPDRMLPDGRTVIEGLLRDGLYSSQFETGISNGSRTAYPGGDRDRWELSLFGGAYQTVGCKPEERPKYGALNVMDYPDGAAPRFGSCYIRLRQGVTDRCTFTFGDSHTGPDCVGTGDNLAPLFVALLDAADQSGHALGAPAADAAAVVRRLLAAAGSQNMPVEPGRALDDYIEAQVHGPIALAADAEALIADPSFRGTTVGEQLAACCRNHGIALLWHGGFGLASSDVSADFRGPAMPPLARRVDRAFSATPGRLDAACVGRAAASLHRHPEQWSDWGTPADTLQHLKQLWHVIVKYGQPL